ncbi:uncharacterized protein CC84DRAFT_1163040 [Paraphaeosphaeria sporulosa]|uniref:F-box domain-containing protein n=1 Tax=Paraphaeosphaeria sporulosa TaxID=1460663 RepID=A0A177CIV7_9PLEO|nr:uncharacterized protein CC84DRAFT_1163040 [Paraphaeosphaeria sporulosa]OAG06717.1 hypothetical protein CC84DRAFT_1163040 [Paraphaeosphaeria sporulosa]
MDISSELDTQRMESPYANYLPDELLLQVLDFLPRTEESQGTLWNFVLVSRQWYSVGISRLYASPFLVGLRYTHFVRTLCPSIIPRIKRSELAGLVKHLDLSRIVHQGAKSTTARLLGRTKNNLELFVAPQASFAINCWAALSKCARLKVLDLGLVSEAISYQSLNQTLRQLGSLEELYMPRCSTEFGYGPEFLTVRLHWPPNLRHLSMSGSVNGKFLWEMLRQPETFPASLHSMALLHCPGLDQPGIKPLLSNLADRLTAVELRDLPAVKQGRFNNIMAWLPHLTTLTIALDYIDEDFGRRPADFTAESHWHLARPLSNLTLLTCGTQTDPRRAFTLVDLWDLIDTRFLGRLRRLSVAASSGWERVDEGALWETVRLGLEALDQENWEARRWHYEGLKGVPEGMAYEEWRGTLAGWRERPRAVVLRNL